MSYLARKEEKMGKWEPHIRHQRGNPKGKKPTEGKGSGESSKFPFLAPGGNDPVAEEVSGGQVNIATWKVNLSDISGSDARGKKNGPGNVLALLTPDSTEEDYADLVGFGNT